VNRLGRLAAAVVLAGALFEVADESAFSDGENAAPCP
jgi:hypothetical protein